MKNVSIIIPCYNDEKYIGDSIESALNQTWEKCELVVVDDGSTDNSLEVARRYESDRVRVISQDNQGPSAARNRGLQECTGEYVQYLDADDLLHPRKIEAQVKALQSSPPRTVVMCSTCYFDNGTDPQDGHLDRGSSVLNSDDPVQWLVDLWNERRGWGMVQTGAWLTPRKIAEDAGEWDERVTLDTDGEYFTRVVLESEHIRYVDGVCVYYRKYDRETTRVSTRRTKETFIGWLRAIDSKRDHVLPRTTDNNRDDAMQALALTYFKLAVEAYPTHSRISETAVRRAEELGCSEPGPFINMKVGRLLRRFFGWRMARRIQNIYHSIV
jgi:glycosyltransferase involved in cell wall biosynthesis